VTEQAVSEVECHVLLRTQTESNNQPAQQVSSGRTVLRSAGAARRARAVATSCCTARSEEYMAYRIWCSTLPVRRDRWRRAQRKVHLAPARDPSMCQCHLLVRSVCCVTSMRRHTQQAGLLCFQGTSAAADASPVIFSSSRLIVFCTQSFDACCRDSTSVRGTGQFRSSEVANGS